MKEKLKPTVQRLSLRQFRAFAEVVRTGTISGAARALAVTPPAIALQLRLLEEALGLPLLERTGGESHPTEAGREVLATALRIEAELTGCAETMHALRGLDRGKVTVGVVSTAKYWAPRALAAFARDRPHIELRVRVGNRSDMIAGLDSFDLDVTVMGRPPDDAHAYERLVVGPHPHVIIAAPSHPLARARGVRLDQLADENFLLREPGSGTRLLMQRLFAEQGMPARSTELGSNETIKQAVMAEMGVALLSAHTIAAEIEAGRLIALPVHGLPIMRQWFLVKRQEKRLLPGARAFWDFLAKGGASFLPGASRPARERPQRTAATDRRVVRRRAAG